MNCNRRWASLTRANEKHYFSHETFLLKKRGIRRGGWRSPTSVDADVDVESSVLQIILDVIAAKHYPALFDDDDDDGDDNDDNNDDGDDANTTRR